MNNQNVTETELAKIRRLADFDLIMLISEIHEHGEKPPLKQACASV
jgi:hypothetical protein